MAEDIKYQINGLPADNIVNIIGSDAGRRSGKGLGMWMKKDDKIES